MDIGKITNNIKEKSRELGYDLCGIIPADSLKEYALYIDKRIEKFPESRHLYEPLYGLSSPEKKEKWAKSIIVCVRRYNKYKIPEEISKYFAKLYLFDVRLTYSDEYKASVMFEEYLKNTGIKFFRDFTAVRLAAVKAGLGQFGKNNFLYTKKFGSWVYVSTWTVDTELEYDNPAPVEDCCPKNCRKCIDACPTGSLSEPFVMDRGTCVTQLCCLSDKIPPERLREVMGTWLYGCDVCQDVCPKNKNKWFEEKEFPGLKDILELLTPEKIFKMDEKTFLETINPRFWYIGDKKMWLWKCNALRAMVNGKEDKYASYVKEASCDSDENVRAMADWALCKLGKV